MRQDSRGFGLLPLGQSAGQPTIRSVALSWGSSRTRAVSRELRSLFEATFGIAGKFRGWTHSEAQIRIGQLVVKANTPNLVESKSLKLYPNGFANERIDSEETLVSRVCDLQEVLGIRPEFASCLR